MRHLFVLVLALSLCGYAIAEENGECVDKLKRCDGFVPGSEDCKVRYIQKSCPVSCGLCQPNGDAGDVNPEDDCKDTLSKCKNLTPESEDCAKAFTKKGCPVACGLCGGEPGTDGNDGGDAAAECKDTLPRCSRLVDGDCDRAFIQKNCRASCNLCDNAGADGGAGNDGDEPAGDDAEDDADATPGEPPLLNYDRNKRECTFREPCGDDGEIMVPYGGIFSDRCGRTWQTTIRCELREVDGPKLLGKDKLKGTCTFDDACNSKTFTVNFGQAFTDSCGRSFIADVECDLFVVEIKGGAGPGVKEPTSRGKSGGICSYADACNGAWIKKRPGETFTDSCGNTFTPNEDCTFSSFEVVGMPNFKEPVIVLSDDLEDKCSYEDQCNGKIINTPKLKSFIDACGIAYTARQDCSVLRAKEDKCKAPVKPENGDLPALLVWNKEKRRCEFADSCDEGKKHDVKFGGVFKDECNDDYFVDAKCNLYSVKVEGKQVDVPRHVSKTGAVCGYADPCTGAWIKKSIGSTFTDACGNTFTVLDGCQLRGGSTFEFEGSPKFPQPPAAGRDDLEEKCMYEDPCDGSFITAKKRTTFEDACKNVYTTQCNCKLVRFPKAPRAPKKDSKQDPELIIMDKQGQSCKFEDQCNISKPIKVGFGQLFTDACGASFIADVECNLFRLRERNENDPPAPTATPAPERPPVFRGNSGGICSYADGCNNAWIKVRPGQEFTDSCGVTYVPNENCRFDGKKLFDDLVAVDPDFKIPRVLVRDDIEGECVFEDPCNGQRIKGDFFDFFRDTCGASYIIARKCLLEEE